MLRNPKKAFQYRICLDIGFIGIARLKTTKDEIYEDVKEILYKESVIARKTIKIAIELFYIDYGTNKVKMILVYV